MASDMNYFYNVVLPQDERSRVESLEPFDEYEEWHLKCAHYILLTAFNGCCQCLAPFVWPQGSSPTAEVDGDIFNPERFRSTDIECGTFVVMSKQSPDSCNAEISVCQNSCDIKELASSDGTKSTSERNQSLLLHDIKYQLPGVTFCRSGSCWKTAELTLVGDETDSRCQRFGHTANLLVINDQHHVATVGGFGVASCGRHRRLSDVTVWNLSAMTSDTYSIDGGGLLSRMCHATVMLGNSTLGNSSLVVVGGRHSPVSPMREHVVLIDFDGNTPSTNSVTCHNVVCSGDVPESCWRHTVVHAVIDGTLITSHHCCVLCCNLKLSFNYPV